MFAFKTSMGTEQPNHTLPEKLLLVSSEDADSTSYSNTEILPHWRFLAFSLFTISSLLNITTTHVVKISWYLGSPCD